MAPSVAVVTGASSGIGLALTQDLIARGWNVIMADINPPKEALPGTKFIKTDIASWDQQAAMFAEAYAWHSRLDFCALNAGIDDRDDIFASIDPATPPRQPNMRTIDVNLTGTYYGVKLAAHYLSRDSSAAGKAKPGGKIVVTASAAGIYAQPSVPQYAASKHAVVGMVRSLAMASRPANITINAVCPALVATGLAPPGLLERFSEAQMTPMSTIVRCFVELASLDDAGDEAWVEGGKNGEVVEGNQDGLVYHAAPSRPASSSYLDEDGARAWAAAYQQRNKNFAEQDWQGNGK